MTVYNEKRCHNEIRLILTNDCRADPCQSLQYTNHEHTVESTFIE